MQQRPRPFGTAGHGLDVVWPPWTGPAGGRPAPARPAELWERRPDSCTAVGERVLADLGTGTGRTDALLVLARYLTLRVARHRHHPIAGFDAGIEENAARQYLAALRADLPEARWLEAVLGCADTPGSAIVSRLNAAASAAAGRGHDHGAFALRYLGWEIAVHSGWHAEAGRIARAIAAAAERGGGRRSRSLWSRRARVHEARAAG